MISIYKTRQMTSARIALYIAPLAVMLCIANSSANAKNLFQYVFTDEHDYDDSGLTRDMITLQRDEDSAMKIQDDNYNRYKKSNGIYFSFGGGMVFPNTGYSTKIDIFGPIANDTANQTNTINQSPIGHIKLPMNPVGFGAYGSIGKSFGFLRAEIAYIMNGSLSIYSDRKYFRSKYKYYLDQFLINQYNGAFKYDISNAKFNNDFRVNVQANAIFANFYFDILQDYSFAFPYVGGGVGYSTIRTSVSSGTFSNMYLADSKNFPKLYDKAQFFTSYKIPPQNESNCAWNFAAGFILRVTEDVEIDLGYKFIQFGTFMSSNKGKRIIDNQTGSPITVKIGQEEGQSVSQTYQPGITETEYNDYFLKPSKLNTSNVSLTLRYKF